MATIYSDKTLGQGMRLPRLLMAGYFLSSDGGSRSVLEDLANRLQDKTSSVICTSTYRNGWLRGADMIATAIIHRAKYDLAVVDLYSGRAFVWGEALAVLLNLMRCPFIFVLRGGALPGFAKHWSKRFEACLSRATIVTAPSDYLLEHLHPYRDDLRLLPNPLDIHAYHFRLRQHPQPKLIWLRSFHHIYNPSLAPKVLSHLSHKFPNLQLMMVGPDKGDNSLQQMQQLALHLKVSRRIILPGGVPKSDVPMWINKGDIFLNTTNVDNTPVSVLEAMACGLCVVSTNVGGIPYLLDNERDALLVPPDDSEAMASAVHRLLTQPGLAERLSGNARKKAEQFDWSVILRRWETLLISAVK